MNSVFCSSCQKVATSGWKLFFIADPVTNVVPPNCYACSPHCVSQTLLHQHAKLLASNRFNQEVSAFLEAEYSLNDVIQHTMIAPTQQNILRWSMLHHKFEQMAAVARRNEKRKRDDDDTQRSVRVCVSPAAVAVAPAVAPAVVAPVVAPVIRRSGRVSRFDAPARPVAATPAQTASLIEYLAERIRSSTPTVAPTQA